MPPASWSLRCGSHCGRFRRLYHKNNDWRFYFLLKCPKSNENLNSSCLFGSNLISKFCNAFLTSFFHIGIYLTTRAWQDQSHDQLGIWRNYWTCKKILIVINSLCWNSSWMVKIFLIYYVSYLHIRILVGCSFLGPIPDTIGSLQQLLYL